jgi:hypothetical protein
MHRTTVIPAEAGILKIPLYSHYRTRQNTGMKNALVHSLEYLGKCLRKLQRLTKKICRDKIETSAQTISM